MSELMWITLLACDEDIRKIEAICRIHNEDLQMSDRFFRFPLHISLKRSFYTEAFAAVKQDLLDLLKKQKTITIRDTELVINRDMIWLTCESAQITALHHQIDETLKKKYGIVIDEYDADYHPHVSLFHDDSERLLCMYERLRKQLEHRTISFDRYVIGASGHQDEYYSLDHS